MNIDHLLSMTFEDCVIPAAVERYCSPDINDQWQLENHRMRVERGDFSRSERPVDEPFVWKD
jgi:hypothetical protein